MRAFLARCSYANVAATAALFIALSGTAVAAHHYSYIITSSKQIKPGTIQVTNLSKKARRALTGQRGMQGLQGIPGVSGQSLALFNQAGFDGTHISIGDGTHATSVVATRSLTSGGYLVSANVIIHGIPSDDVTCEVATGTNVSTPTQVIFPGGGQLAVSLEAPVQITASVPAIVKCFTASATSPYAVGATVSAVPYTTITVG